MSIKKMSNDLSLTDYQQISSEIVDDLLGIMARDPVAIKNFASKIFSLPLQIQSAIYWHKFENFLTGIDEIEKDLGQSVKLSSILFSNEHGKKENGYRLLVCIDKIDTDSKIEYLLNASRSLMCGCIAVTDYFRIINAIVYTLTEDLEKLQELDINKQKTITGDVSVMALERSGLVIQDGIDCNEDIEEQEYIISSLGKLVVTYALSVPD